MKTTRRGYSREFQPRRGTARRYLLDAIPAGLWTSAQAKAKREGISMRALILTLLEQWAAGAIELGGGRS